MKHLFIINPEAGKGKSMTYVNVIKEYFQHSSDSYIIEITKYPGHATELVKDYTSRENYRVYAMGGDGTLNEVLNGMINTNSVLGVIPCGSGNDFVKSIVDDMDRDIFKRTIEGKEEFIDLGMVNGKYFLNISSVGFDSVVVYHANHFKKMNYISGSTAYILGILKTLFTFNSIHASVEIDGATFNKNILLAAVANGKCYGGGVKISPKSIINDGAFDICLVDNTSKLKIFFFFPKAIKGTHESIKEVSFYKGKKITIMSQEEFVLNIDGELFKEKKATFEMIHNGIKVLMPRE